MNRQTMKSLAFDAIKKHYYIYILACLIAAFLGTEFLSSTTLITSHIAPPKGEEAISYYSSAFLSNGNMYDYLIKDYNKRKIKQEQKIKNSDNSKISTQIFSRKDGVFAATMNGITSGSFLSQFLMSVRSMTGSDNIAVFILVFFSMMCLFLFWFYIKNVFQVVIRRLFLEGRTYDKLPFQRYLFIIWIKKWNQAALTMFLTSLYKTLWSFTIIGGFIKHYSYLMVPYIVAENPSIPANKAITMSRNMMKGQKFRFFINDCTFIGWFFLGAITFGISDAIFTNAYRTCYFAECYAFLREKAKADNLADSELLNDTYLFQYAEDELLQNAYSDIHELSKEDLSDPAKSYTGIVPFVAKWFGISLFQREIEDEFEKRQAKKFLLEKYQAELNHKAYPNRLYPLPSRHSNPLIETINYMRRYTISSIVLMFFIFSGIGWLWEVCFHLVCDAKFVNRGVLHGPWLPIYGVGSILILILLNRFRSSPISQFVSATVLCGVVEYFTAVYLEYTNGGTRWWDYTGYFLNINGRICAEGLMLFAIGGCATVYFVAPLLDNALRKIKPSIATTICVILISVFIADLIYSHNVPNKGKGITDYTITAPPSNVKGDAAK